MLSPRVVMLWFASAILSVTLAVSCGGSDSTTVKELEFGEQWPLTVPEAELFCKEYYAIYVKVGEHRYGINGMGKSYLKSNHSDSMRELKDIWRPDPRGVVSRVNITPLIEAGERLCND